MHPADGAQLEAEVLEVLSVRTERTVTAEMSLLDVSGPDSLTFLELSIELERSLGIEIGDDEIADLAVRPLGQIVAERSGSGIDRRARDA